ncbi:hypothetical protein E2K98_14960 [Bacillus salipaludis]|uniref:DUF2269 family protein n=1 Tax=Bacillus salipaludis TaxID=2547811 RepID=A0A4R5VQZ4_9BACI|nr:hypothetical protein [Bacillus salipaludis]MDQ6598437.1 hypothetical protein [Bacillus salipaludis]TDK61003.1 hypothetical protein E2K98_14960 [Bacillus salipaludis]
MLYNFVLFLHILGAVIMFAAVGITLTAMIAMLHSTKTDYIRIWSALAVKLDGLLPFSVILILLLGLYLVISTWGWGKPWVDFSLAALIIMTFMGPIINLRRLKAVLSAAITETNEVPSSGLIEKVRDRVLWNSVLIMTMLTLAILFLMAMKIALLGSIITLVVAIILGFIVSKIVLSRASTKIATSNNTFIEK